MTGFQAAIEHHDFISALAQLQKAKLTGEKIDLTVFSEVFRRATWLATYMANSKDIEHRKKALMFAAFSKIAFPDDPKVDALCYTVFARTGALPAAKHLSEKLIGVKQLYVGPALGPLSDEFITSYYESYSELAGGIVLTEFQKNTEEALCSEACNIISAPTSAGKSFIIHEYVKNMLRQEQQYLALFIVPTKALISQTCAIYRRFKVSEDIPIEVLSSVSDETEIPHTRIVFALTQERCLKLLSMPIAKKINFIFADDIQGLEDGERGALLEYILHELRTIAPNAKIFAAGPFISNGKELNFGLFEQEKEPITTEASPVSQLLIQLKPIKRKKQLEMKIVDKENSEKDSVFNVQTEISLFSRWKTSSMNAICDSVKKYSSNSSTIVYARGTKTSQNWAIHYIEDIESRDEISQGTNDLIQYIRESIHPKWSLIECLKNRVAYHHGAMPDFVREEVEEQFKQKEIDVLFCTSTLLQGVNLPAEKIFIISPQQAYEDMSSFQFKNLIGRAGRLDKHLCGIVFCVQQPKKAEEEDWIEKFRKDTKINVEPTVDAKLGSSFDEVLQLLQDASPMLPKSAKKDVRSVVTVLRARSLKGDQYINKYIESKNLTKIQKIRIFKALENTKRLLAIPNGLASKNPFIDPILQDKLYRSVKENPSQWIVRRGQGRGVDFRNVFMQLDRLFHIVDEIDPFKNVPDDHEKKPTLLGIYRDKLLRLSMLWVKGTSFREIVNKNIPKPSANDSNIASSKVDNAISEVMKIINKDITFVAAKYFGLLSEFIKYIIPDNELEKFEMTISLPIQLELGCSDTTTMALIKACIPRGAALIIADKIPEELENPVDWLTKHQSNRDLQQLPRIYHKILQRCGIWQENI